MNKEDEKKFKKIFNKSADRLLDTLNNNPDELFDIKNLSKQLADKSKQIYKLTKENTNLKQALIDIREIINDCKKLMPHEFDCEEQADNILQIIDKVLGDEK